MLFFAFIILTDPPTSPVKYADQIGCGVLVALVSYAFFEWAGVVYYLLASALAGNVWKRGDAPIAAAAWVPEGMGALLNEMAPWNQV